MRVLEGRGKINERKRKNGMWVGVMVLSGKAQDDG